ncbi:uncharacterized protein LOC108046579 isoform X2 [Drosophila rhopaloa]|uniref:Uncharacterized protein LOC108046579 n=1 Tax=Drosophila rhopaloa TaxID=1041015 RepID=A0A6P4F8Y5_DRORH|nr:uncharacterized protein LOC108046579 isoform X2 [Drosophila rhopaloa]
MMSSYYLAIILAVLFGHLQFQAIVVARVARPAHRHANATVFTPARTHNGGYNHSAFGPVNTNYTHPGFALPPQNRTWLPTNQILYGATSGSVSAPSAPASSGWIASKNPQTGALPSGWFQPNAPQGQVVAPALIFRKINGTSYTAYNQTTHTVSQGGRAVNGSSYSSPYGNLSI